MLLWGLPAQGIYQRSCVISQIGNAPFVVPNPFLASPVEVNVCICTALGPHLDAGFAVQDETVGELIGVQLVIIECPTGHILVAGCLVLDDNEFFLHVCGGLFVRLGPGRVVLYVGDAQAGGGCG